MTYSIYFMSLVSRIVSPLNRWLTSLRDTPNLADYLDLVKKRHDGITSLELLLHRLKIHHCEDVSWKEAHEFTVRLMEKLDGKQKE